MNRSRIERVPSRRVGDSLGRSRPQSVLPIGKTLRRMAEKILHNRIVIPKKKSTRPPTARFTDDQVRAIRRLNTLGADTKDLSLLTGMDADCLSKVIDGTNYSKVL